MIAENLCLRQQLLVLQRRHPRPRLSNADRRFWILASRWLGGWRKSLVIVTPETVLSWQRLGWRAYWTWRSSRRARGGRPAIAGELQALIRRMSTENALWGQKRIQAELARLGFKVSARTVAKYMRARNNRGPSPGWREFLKRHAPDIWACDFFCVRTVLFQTFHVFFVVRHANREILHAEVTRHPTADWAAQQIVECCARGGCGIRLRYRERPDRTGTGARRRNTWTEPSRQGRLSKASGAQCSHRDLVVCVSLFLTDTEVIMTTPVTIVRRRRGRRRTLECQSPSRRQR